MLKIYQFSPLWGLPNASPFCLKLETYCRLANIPYEVVNVNDPRRSPKGKLPHIQHGNKTIGDSELIIDYLKQHYPDPDAHLSAEQKGIALAITRLCDEHLYWVALYSRWVDPNYWPILKANMFGKLPLFKRTMLELIYRRVLKNQIYQQGMGRHTPNEIYEFGIKDLKAIESLIKDKDYFFGDQITSIDATCFGFLANIIYPPMATPMQEFALNSAIKPYCDRIFQRYYPELFAARS